MPSRCHQRAIRSTQTVRNQIQSEAIRGNQRHSEVIRSTQTVRNQMQSDAIRCNQIQSDPIRSNQTVRVTLGWATEWYRASGL